MNTKVVRNISENELVIPNIGVVKAGDTIEVPADFNNANFVEVKKEPKTETKNVNPASSKQDITK